MFLGVDWEPILPVISAVLVIGAVLVGIAGLYSDELVKNRKLTRPGRAVAGLMVLLGAGSIIFGVASQKVMDRNAREESGRRDTQFHRQMETLQRATSSLTILQSGMEDTLRSQRELYGIADRTQEMSADLQRQSQANTLSVLRRVFAEGNRVAAERVAIAVTYRCPPADLFTDGPRILGALVRIRSRSGPEVTLTTRQATELNDGLVFHGFLGDLGPFETFPAWRDARVYIRLSGGDIRFGTALADLVNLTDEEVRRAENPAAVSCPTTARLLLNGRQVMVVSGSFTRRGSRHDYAAEFADLRVEPNRLPRFSN